jgi:L-cysteine desulfidase
MKKHKIEAILEKELVIALGCTEPVAIALAAATAKSYAKGQIEKITLKASGNIIKNAKSVGIPGMTSSGLDFSVALGVVSGDPTKQLELLDGLTFEDEQSALRLIEEGKVLSGQADTPKRLYIEVTLKTNQNTTKVVISDNHSNITLIEVDGKVVFQGGCEDIGIQSNEEELFTLTIDEIVEWVQMVDIHSLSLVKKSIELNKVIGQEGLQGDYGLKVGKTSRMI